MVYIDDLIDKMKDAVKYQQLPSALTDTEYENIMVRSIKRLFVDTGRAESFSASSITRSATQGLVYSGDFEIDEEEYILIVSQIAFYKIVQNAVNNIVGYTTNALSVTGADKPYAHLQDTISLLENDRRIIFYKMTRYIFEQGD